MIRDFLWQYLTKVIVSLKKPEETPFQNLTGSPWEPKMSENDWVCHMGMKIAVRKAQYESRISNKLHRGISEMHWELSPFH